MKNENTTPTLQEWLKENPSKGLNDYFRAFPPPNNSNQKETNQEETKKEGKNKRENQESSQKSENEIQDETNQSKSKVITEGVEYAISPFLKYTLIITALVFAFFPLYINDKGDLVGYLRVTLISISEDGFLLWILFVLPIVVFLASIYFVIAFITIGERKYLLISSSLMAIDAAFFIFFTRKLGGLDGHSLFASVIIGVFMLFSSLALLISSIQKPKSVK